MTIVCSHCDGNHMRSECPIDDWNDSPKRLPQRYDIATDEMIEVTQEWVDQMGALLQALGSARRAAKRALVVEDGIVKMTHPALQEFLDAWKPEFEQKP